LVSVVSGAGVRGLVEREGELAVVDGVFDRVGAGGGRWLWWKVRRGLARASC
jgi:hypothetical protein